MKLVFESCKNRDIELFYLQCLKFRHPQECYSASHKTSEHFNLYLLCEYLLMKERCPFTSRLVRLLEKKKTAL